MGKYIHFTEEQKLRANSVDLVDFLQRQGEKLLPSGREKRLDSDHSITVRRNEWYDHSSKQGGLAIDFVQNFYGLSFPDAVTMLLGGEQGVAYSRAKNKKQEGRKPFELPPRHTDMRRVFAYLIKNRYIHRDVVSFFAKQKLLYESCELSKDKTKEYHNAVFIGLDENDVPRHGHKHGIYTNGSSFKGNIDSSNPGYSFHYIGTSNRLYVFESPIDMLSFITTYKNTGWQQHSYVALCGVSEQAMMKMIETNSQLNHVILCLDHDETGIEAMEKFQDMLHEKKIDYSKMFSKYKDWNEDIKDSLNLPAIPSEEHSQHTLRDEICTDIQFFMKEIKNKDCSLEKLKENYIKCKTASEEQIVEDFIQLSALSLCLAKKEYKQMGSEVTAEDLIRKTKDSFKAYQNRSKLNNRMNDIQKELDEIDKQQGIISKTEKIRIAEGYEAIALSSLKGAIIVELNQQRQEQKQILKME